MLMAVSVVLGYFTIEAGPYLKIGFGGVVNQFVYYLFGPVAGAVYGGVLDLVKYVVKPTGAFFPGFTLNAMLGGVLYGTILYRKPLTFRRALWADLVVSPCCPRSSAWQTLAGMQLRWCFCRCVCLRISSSGRWMQHSFI